MYYVLLLYEEIFSLVNGIKGEDGVVGFTDFLIHASLHFNGY
jgi:hypothetical protein